MSLEAVPDSRLPTVCPFVAFADDRDLRAAEPDRRHRCYAVLEPEPRALAHQSRYCLSPTFTSCPIFQDWAAREAAHVAPGEEPVGAAAAGLFDEESSGPVPTSRAETATSGGRWSAGRQAFEDDGVDEDESAAGATVAAAAASREWDRPRRQRDYPPLGRRRTPPILTGIVILAIAALAVFLLPTILRVLFGGAGPGASPTTSPSAAAGSASPGVSPSPSSGATGGPSATPLVYIIQTGDNLTKIATKFNTTIPAILAANPTITNPNDIKVGEPIIIPTLGAPGPSATASP